MTATGEKDMLPYSRPVVTDDDVEAVTEVLRGTMISQGERLRSLESAFADAVGARWAVAASSGTAALHAMCHAAGFGPGDEVVVPALTFAGTANAILYTGARPVFVDVDAASLCADPEAVAAAATPATRGVVGVDFAGHPVDYRGLRSVADRGGLVLLSDAAHAPGASYEGVPVGGATADMTAFSLNPVKNITAAEGGFVTSASDERRDAVARFVVHGMTRDPGLLEDPTGADNGWYYEQQVLGFNYKLSELHAALALSQLSRLRANNEHRARLAGYYSRALGRLPLRLPVAAPGVVHAWHLYVIRLEEGGADVRNRLFEHMRRSGIGVQLHYIPVPLHPYYRRLGYDLDGLPNTRAYFDSAMSIPLHPGMDERDCDRVVEALGSFFA